MNRLLKLIEGAKDANGNAAASGNEMRANSGEADDDDGEGGGKGSKDKMDKVGILEVVGNRLEEVEAERDRLKADLTKEREKSVELSEAVMRMSKQAKALTAAGGVSGAAAGGASSDSLSILDPLTSLSPSARSYISQLEQSSALYSSSFIHSSLIFLILSVTTGRCVDANSKFCQVAGWKREEVIGKPFVQPKAELMQESKESTDSNNHHPHGPQHHPDGSQSSSSSSSPHSSSSSSSSSSSAGGGGGGSVGGGVGGAGMLMWGVGMGKNSRYASNRAELLALYTGRKKAVTCCFRVALAKGQLVDVRCRCWLGHAGEGADAVKDVAAAAASVGAASGSGAAIGGAAGVAGADGVKTEADMVATHLIVQTTEEDIIVLS